MAATGSWSLRRASPGTSRRHRAPQRAAASVRGEVLDAERIVVGRDERQEVVDPALDVRLSHAHLDLLVEQRHHRHRIDHAAVDADDGERAAAPHRVDRSVQHGQPVDARLLDQLRRDGVGQEPGKVLGELSERGAVGLHADRVDDGVRPAAVGQLAQRLGDVIVVAQIDDLGAVTPRELEPLRHEVDAQHPRGAAQERHPAAHLADRAEAVDGHGAAGGDGRVVHCLPGRRQHVREVDEAIVGRPVRHLDGAVVRLRDAQELGLASGHLAVQLRVAEQRRALALLAHLRRLALRLQVLVAHVAMTARDVERDHDAIAGSDVRHLRADLLDDAHGLVTEDVALVEIRAEHLVEMQVGAADAGRRHADDRVGGFADLGVGDGVHSDVALAVPDDGLHAGAPPQRGQGGRFMRRSTHRLAGQTAAGFSALQRIRRSFGLARSGELRLLRHRKLKGATNVCTAFGR